jgi:release factor glutamine methyltransferase
MSLRQALEEAKRILAANGIPDTALESELLLRHLLGINRVQLYLDLDDPLTGEQQEAYRRLIERRAAGQPSAYIIGGREFYGLEFIVDSRVLIPRPESELLVDEAIRLAGRLDTAPVIADIGTGSGAIAICLAIKLPQATIYASDISAATLEVAAANCRRHGVAGRVRLFTGDLLTPLPQPVDIIVANLPYVGRAEAAANRFEPSLALDGGPGGTEEIERLCRQVAGKLRPGGVLLLEIGQGQQQEITDIVMRLFPGSIVEVTPDLAGIPRVVSAAIPVGHTAPCG